MYASLDAIIGAIFPIIFIGFFFWIIPFMQRKSFGSLLKNFKSEDALPSSMIRVSQLGFGTGVRYNNIVKAAEDQNSFSLKVPFISHIKIPLAEIAQVTLKDGVFKSKFFAIQFKNNELPNLTLTFRPNDIAAFPQLARLAGKQEGARNIASNPDVPKEVFNPQQPYNMGEIQNKAGNWARGLILIGVIVFVVFLYLAYNGG